jgi:hypothetical protein
MGKEIPHFYFTPQIGRALDIPAGGRRMLRTFFYRLKACYPVVVFSILAVALPVSAFAEILVGNMGSNTLTFFETTSQGDAAPLRTVSGGATGLNYPAGVAVSNGEIFVANHWAHTIGVFNLAAQGDAAPVRTIGGGQTGLSYPEHLWIDGGELYVANYGGGITVYDTTNNGDVSPKRTITTVGNLMGVAVLGNNLFVVHHVESGDNTVYIFDKNGNGTPGPARTITGSPLNGPMAVVPSGSELFVANFYGNSIAVYDIDASGTAAAKRVITGPATQLNAPIGAWVEGVELFVTCYLGSPTARVLVFNLTDSGDVAPKRVLSGPQTQLNAPTGIVLFGPVVDVCPGCDHTTIQSAVDAIPEGSDGTIRVAQGEYIGRVTLNTPKKIRIEGGWNADFSSRSADPSLTVIRIQGGNGAVTTEAGAGETIGLTLERLTLTGAGFSGYEWGGGLSGTAKEGGTLNLTVRECLITGNSASHGYGIGVGLQSYGAGSLLNFTLSSTRVSGNSVTFYTGGGLNLWAYQSGVLNASLTNNLIADNSAMYGGGIAVSASNADGVGTPIEPGTVNLTMINNTVANNTAWKYSYYGGGYGGGLLLQNFLGDIHVTLVNNIVWGNTATLYGGDLYMARRTEGASCGTPGAFIVDASYSDLGQVCNDCDQEWPIGPCPATFNEGPGMLSLNPDFAAPASQDYHLGRASQVKDVGTSVGAPSTDLDGKGRPFGPGFDMGAYEFHGIGRIQVNPGSYPFGDVPIGSSSTPGNFLITNTGTAALHITAAGLSDPANFSFTGGTCANPPFVLDPGGNCSIEVTFTPQSLGFIQGNLTVQSDDPDAPQTVVTMSGTGVLPLFEVTAYVTGGHGTILCDTPVAQGSGSVCTVAAGAGYHLSGLTDNGTDRLAQVTGNTYTLTNITEAHLLYATFAINTYAITTSMPGGHGTLLCVSPVNHGDNSVCTITPDPGYLLATLTDNGVDVLSSVNIATYTIAAVTAPHTVTAAYARFTVSPKQGTVGTELLISGPGFGSKKGKVYLEKDGTRYATKVTEWNIGGSGLIRATVSKAVPPGIYKVVLVSKELPGGEIGEAGAFEARGPRIDTVTANAGWAPGAEVVIDGDYFGIKKPKVYLGTLSCKVTGYGMKELKILVPKQLTVGQTYMLRVVVAGVGEGTRSVPTY